MNENPELKLEKLGISLPDAPTSVANYLPFVIIDKLIYVSGQLSILNGGLQYLGVLGRDLSVKEGYEAARICGLNLISQARVAAGGDLNNIAQVIKIGGFVNSMPEFTDQPQVINGASDLMVEVFGHTGKHARFAVSATSLPLGVSVEIDGIFKLI